MTHQFPHWAPNAVVQRYHNQIRTSEGADPKGTLYPYSITRRAADSAHVLKLLLTDPAMEKIWQNVGVHISTVEKSDPHPPGLLLLEFAINAEEAAAGPASPWDLMPPNERQKKLTDTIGKLSALSETAAELDIGTCLLPYFEEEELNGMGLFLSGYGLSDWNSIEEAQPNLPDVPSIRFCLAKATPTLSELLARIAQRLNQSPPYQTPLLARPGSANASRTFLFRKLVQFNERTFGKPLWDITHGIAQVLLKEELDESAIRNSVRGASQH